MKLSDYAKHLGIAYQTAWKHYKKGLIPHPTRQLPSGAVIVEFDPKNKFDHRTFSKAAIYTRVSSAENRKNLDSQAERLCQYSTAKGYQIIHVVKEVGSGLNDHRKKLEKLLTLDDYDILIVEHKDRLCRFGSNYMDLLLSRLGIRLEIVNMADNNRDELMTDLVAIITSFAARLYGQRRGKRKTETIIATLEATSED